MKLTKRQIKKLLAIAEGPLTTLSCFKVAEAAGSKAQYAYSDLFGFCPYRGPLYVVSDNERNLWYNTSEKEREVIRAMMILLFIEVYK